MAKEKGITKEEMGAIQAIVMAVSAGRVGAQFGEARKRRLKAERAQGEGGQEETS